MAETHREREDGVARSAEPVSPAMFFANPAPMALFDLDAAGLDPTQPAPPELIQFLYDQSRAGYLTLWSATLMTPDGASVIQRWINDALQVYYSRSLLTQMAPPAAKPAGANVTEVTYTGPTGPPAPVLVDIPVVTGTGEVGQPLMCTMGNWGNTPTSYAYQWSNGANVGDGTSTYTVDAADAGLPVSCVVTATNAGGSTAAPASNAVLVPGAAAASASAHRNTTTTRSNPDDEHHRRR